MAIFKVQLNRRNILAEELIADLSRVAIALGHNSVTKLEYDVSGKFGATTIIRKLGSWNKGLLAAGLEINCQQGLATEVFHQNLANVWAALGRQPLGREMSDKLNPSTISLGAYEKRFGSWNKALLAFADFIKSEIPEQVVTPIKPAYRQKGRISGKINWRLRARILIRDSCICQLCGTSPAKNSNSIMHVDHKIPHAKGGETIEENLQTLCMVCNIGKSDAL